MSPSHHRSRQCEVRVQPCGIFPPGPEKIKIKPISRDADPRTEAGSHSPHREDASAVCQLRGYLRTDQFDTAQQVGVRQARVGQLQRRAVQAAELF